MKKSLVQAIAGLVVLGVCLTVPWLFRNQFQLVPWSTELAYEYPGFVVSDSSGNSYLIDRSQKRVVKTSIDGELVWTIAGGTRDPGSFYFADELSVDDEGFVYVINRVPDAPGFYTVSNQVLRFGPDGSFDQIVAEQSYPESSRTPTLVQRGHWHSLQARAGKITWFDSTGDGLVLYSGSPGAMEKSVVVPAIAADLLVPSAAATSTGSVVYITRQGRILEKSAGEDARILWDASNRSANSTPWRLRTTATGQIFFTDLARKAVAEVKPDGTAPVWFAGEALIYSLSAGASGTLGISGDAGPQLLSAEGQATTLPAAARFSLGEVVLHWVLWALLLLALVTLIFLGWLGYVEGFKRQLPRFFKTVLGVVLLTGVVTAFVSVMILSNFSQRYSTEVLDKLTQLVHLVPKVLPTDKLMAIQEPDQFGGQDYNDLRSQIIRDIYGAKGQGNQGLYFAVHRLTEGQLTTFMYLNGDTTIQHPFSYLEDPTGPYQQALKGETVAQYALDAWGSWMYATSPITAPDGNVVGVFEMGGDLYSFTQENNRLIQSLLLNVLTVVIVFLLILVESTFLQDQLSKRRAETLARGQGIEPRRQEERFQAGFLVRPLTAVFFVGTSLTLLFLPLMTKDLYQPLLGLPENVVYGLPVSLRLFFFGLGTVIAGNLSLRWGWRALFLAGAGLLALGLAAAALAPDLIWFLVASVPIGLGTGLGMIGLRSLIHAEGAEGQESRTYSHFYAGIIAGTNVGVIVGTALADFVGFANVSWFAAVITVLSAVMVLWLFPRPKAPRREGQLRAGQAIRLFFTNPGILRFGLFLVLPIYVASMVLYYFFPIYAAEQGVSNGDMGRIFLLNGLIIVYLGPALSRFVQSRFGVRGGLAITTLLWVVSLVPFLLTNDLFGLILTIALMAVAEGTAAPAQNEHLISLPVSQSIGADRAVGFFEVVAKVGETVAPILIGFAILLGARWGIALIAAALAAGLILFQLFDSRRKAGAEA